MSGRQAEEVELTSSELLRHWEEKASLAKREMWARIHLGLTVVSGAAVIFFAGYWYGLGDCQSFAEKLKNFLF